MNFLKKHWDLIVWGVIALVLCYTNAAKVSAQGFLMSVGSYAVGIAVYFAVLTVLVFLSKFLTKAYQAWREAPSPGEEDNGDTDYNAACAWRDINLALAGNGDHIDACFELASLREAGWTVAKTGHERDTVVTLTFVKPGVNLQDVNVSISYVDPAVKP